jgi:hypothetical protein
VAVRVPGRAEAEQLAVLDAAGHTERFPGWYEWTTTKLHVASGRPVALGVDGEALTFESPLDFVIRPRALVVRVPRVPAKPRRKPPPAIAAPPSPFTVLSRLAAGHET